METTQTHYRTIEDLSMGTLHPCVAIACERLYRRHRQVSAEADTPPRRPGLFLNECMARGILDTCRRHGVTPPNLLFDDTFPSPAMAGVIETLRTEHFNASSSLWWRPITFYEYRNVLMLNGLQAMGAELEPQEQILNDEF